MTEIQIRKGEESDVPVVMGLILELAQYERALDRVETTEQILIEDGFGPSPSFQFLVAVSQQQIVGLSLFYYRYSTWKGKGLYLEDLIVTKEFRGLGIGKDLLKETAKYGLHNQCTAMYWQVLDWNTPAIDFYQSLGTKFDGEWINCRLDRKSMEKIN
ncbi:MAG: N-acetyltransferase [Cyclobacteriaceae bacterium]|nr:MAG: N-acetyltransferase [Cyclobacteriaceae bacterium]